MAINLGVTREYSRAKNMREFTAYLLSRGYGLADFSDRPRNFPSESDVQIQDPARAMTRGLIFRERVLCNIGRTFQDDRGISVHIYGREYFERMKQDLEEYPHRDGVDLTILLHSDKPQLGYPDREFGIS